MLVSTVASMFLAPMCNEINQCLSLYHLDITPRVIAMGFPSENLEGIFRNPMSEVTRYVDGVLL